MASFGNGGSGLQIPVPWHLALALRLGLKTEDEVARAALVLAHQDHADSGATGALVASAAADHTPIDAKGLAALQVYCNVADASDRDDASENAAASRAANAAVAGKVRDMTAYSVAPVAHIEFVADPKSYRLGPRAQIALSNLIVIVVSAAALLLTSGLLQQFFSERRAVTRVEGLRTAVATFGDGFEAEYVSKALFELEDEANTTATWIGHTWSLRLRDAAAHASVTASLVAGAARSASPGIANAVDSAASDFVAAVDELAADADAVVGAPALSASPVAAGIAELAGNFPSALHAAVLHVPTHILGRGAQATLQATTVSHWWNATASAGKSVAAAEATRGGAAWPDFCSSNPGFEPFGVAAVDAAIEAAQGVPESPRSGSLFASEDGGELNGTVTEMSALLGRYRRGWWLYVPQAQTAVILAASRAGENRLWLSAVAAAVADAHAAIKEHSPRDEKHVPSVAQCVSRDSTELGLFHVVCNATDGSASITARHVAPSEAGTGGGFLASTSTHAAVEAWLIEALVSAASPKFRDAAAVCRGGLAGFALASQLQEGDSEFQAGPSHISAQDDLELVGGWSALDPAFLYDDSGAPLMPRPSVAVVVTLTSRACLRADFTAEAAAVVEGVTARKRSGRDVALFAQASGDAALPAVPLTLPREEDQCVGDEAPIGSRCASAPEWLAFGAGTFQALNNSGQQLAVSRRGIPAAVAFATIPGLDAALVLSEELHVVRGRARASLRSAVDRAMTAVPVDARTRPPDVALFTAASSSGAPAARTFDGSAPCREGIAVCVPLWSRCDEFNATSDAPNATSWCRSGAGQRSDCAGCLPSDLRAASQSVQAPGEADASEQLAQRSSSVPPSSKQILLPRGVLQHIDAILAPFLPPQAPGNRPWAAEDVRDAALTKSADGTMTENNVAVAFAPLPTLGAVVTVALDLSSLRDEVGAGVAAIAVSAALCAIAVGAIAVRFLALRVVAQVEREWRRTREEQTREQHKLTKLVRRKIPPVIATKLPGEGVFVERRDGAVCTVDTVHFSDESSSWSPRNVVRYLTYYRHVAFAAAKACDVALLLTYGDVLQIASVPGVGGGDGGARSAHFGTPAVPAVQFAAVMLQLASHKFVHQPWLIEAFEDLFKLTRQERQEEAEAARLAASTNVGAPGAHGVTSADSSVNAKRRESTILSGGTQESEGSDSEHSSGGSLASGFGGAPDASRSHRALRRHHSKAPRPGSTVRRVNVPKDAAMPDFALLPCRAGVTIGTITLSAARLTALTPQFDCFSDVFAAAGRLQATAPPGRVHVSAQVRDIIGARTEELKPVAFAFSTPLRTVLKGGRGVSTFLLAGVTVPIPEDVLNSTHILHADRAYICPGNARSTGSGGASSSERSEVASSLAEFAPLGS